MMTEADFDISELPLQRDRLYRRTQRDKHINRKIGIINAKHNWVYKCPGSLSKGKIHCSCPMCRRKSYETLKPNDKRKLDSMREDRMINYG